MKHRIGFLILVLCLRPAGVTAQTGWSASLGGNGFLSYMRHNTFRGAQELDAIGWAMGTVTRDYGGRSIAFNGMVSLDPITLGECGYPRVMPDSGLCNDAPFEDRSHTHPFIMDLSAVATHVVGRTRLSLRGGLAGAPALGPTSYMHRPSAQFDPVIPLTHHSLNPVHVANGFVTAGINRGRASLEVSAFNASSDDSSDYDFDLAPLHAWSGRVGWNLGAMSRAQVSAAVMEPGHGAHAGHGDPGEKLHAYTASIEAMRMVGSATVDATLAWSRQTMTDMTDDGALVEATLRRGVHALSLRGEILERTEFVGEHIGEEHIVTPLGTRRSELSGGYALRLTEKLGLAASIGVRGAITFVPDYWQQYYEASRARSLAVFINVQPSRHAHHSR